MIIDEKKYEKWKAITESDFVTMFIKTWFTYIAVLREIYPEINIFTAEGMPRGDKPFLNAFNNGMLTIVQKQIEMDNITQNLFMFYPVCMRKVIQIFPQYFFQTFYHYNEDFKYDENNIIKHTDGSIKERWQLNLKIENRYILKFYLGLSGKLYSNNYNKNLKCEFNLKDIVLSAIDEQKDKSDFDEIIFIKYLYEDLQKQIETKLYSYITDEIPNLPFCASIKNKIRSGCERAASTLRLNFENNYRYADALYALKPESTYMVFQQLPFQLFYRTYAEQQYASKKETYDSLLITKGLEWFSGFVYQLRNALFHEIIDPLDEDWQTIFKSAYLILKPITDICIDFLDQVEIINDSTGNSVAEFIVNNAHSCIDIISTHTIIEGAEKININSWSISNGRINITGEVNLSVKLQFGTDSDERNGDGIKANRSILCSFAAKTDDKFNVLGNPQDGFDFGMDIIDVLDLKGDLEEAPKFSFEQINDSLILPNDSL